METANLLAEYNELEVALLSEDESQITEAFDRYVSAYLSLGRGIFTKKRLGDQLGVTSTSVLYAAKGITIKTSSFVKPRMAELKIIAEDPWTISATSKESVVPTLASFISVLEKALHLEIPYGSFEAADNLRRKLYNIPKTEE